MKRQSLTATVPCTVQPAIFLVVLGTILLQGCLVGRSYIIAEGDFEFQNDALNLEVPTYFEIHSDVPLSEEGREEFYKDFKQGYQPGFPNGFSEGHPRKEECANSILIIFDRIDSSYEHNLSRSSVFISVVTLTLLPGYYVHEGEVDLIVRSCKLGVMQEPRLYWCRMGRRTYIWLPFVLLWPYLLSNNSVAEHEPLFAETLRRNGVIRSLSGCGR